MMLKPIAILLCALVSIGCSRRSLEGVYQTVGSEQQFKMTLELKKDGTASFATISNLGAPAMDAQLRKTMSIPTGRWAENAGFIVVTGDQPDGKRGDYRFAPQPNGHLIWTQTGARFVKGN